MPRFEVELVRTIRTRVIVDADSAAEIKRRIAGPDDNFDLDLFAEGEQGLDMITVRSVKAAP